MTNLNYTKVVLITGGARRIGAACVRYFHQQGFRIALHYHQSEKEAKIIADELNNKQPHSVSLFCCHLSEINGLSRLIEKVIHTYGRLDVLINNAAVFFPTSIAQASCDDWDNLLNINLKVPFFLSQTCLPYLIKTQGAIVNMVDIHGERPMADYSIYSISKAALIMQTKAFAKDCAPHVRVNAVALGAILPPESVHTEDVISPERIIKNVPLKKWGKPEEVAQAVFFLANHGHITGAILPVDGGQNLSI